MLSDLPKGKGYKNDQITVKAGYMRNFLYPSKLAVYATNENRMKFGHPEGNRGGGVTGKNRVLDDDDDDDDDVVQETVTTVQDIDELKELRKAGDLLVSYLRGKRVTIKRNFVGDRVGPGAVNARTVQEKLFDQHKILLEGEEWIGLERDMEREVVEGGEGAKGAKGAKGEEKFDKYKGVNLPGEKRLVAEGEHTVFINLMGGVQVPLEVEIVRR